MQALTETPLPFAFILVAVRHYGNGGKFAEPAYVERDWLQFLNSQEDVSKNLTTAEHPGIPSLLSSWAGSISSAIKKARILR